VVITPLSIGASFHTTSTRHGLDVLDFLAYLLIEDGVGEVHNALMARVGMRVFPYFGWAEYARLDAVHSGTAFVWAGSRGMSAPAGPFIYPTLISYLFSFLFSTCFVALLSLFSVE